MRLVTYDRGGSRRLGAQVNGLVVDLPEVVGHPAFPRTLEALVARSRGTVLDAARSALAQPAYLHDCDVPGARLLAPLLIHGREDVVAGPDAELLWPGPADRLDCEPEIACVVGRLGRDLSPAEAEEAIFGYTLVNGWWAAGPRAGASERERVLFATSMGPCVVTADEVDLRRSHLVARVDGEVWLEEDLRVTAATFARTVARISAREGVRPGDLFSAPVTGRATSGRLFGDRSRRRRARGGHRPLPPDVVVEIEVGGIGTLRNRVSVASRATPLMPTRVGPAPAAGLPGPTARRGFTTPR
jgi:2-keto-4-pentenoate hydratase/2-oxohepta-3-ene-1,7-dioic acid hydratase in catechol pathway